MNDYPARAIVDHSAIRSNVARLREVAGPAAVMAIIKSNAYGHGLFEVARSALAGGAGWLGVAQVSEALKVRAAGIDAPLLSWMFTPDTSLTEAVRDAIDLSASAPWALRRIDAAARETGTTARVHLKIDTGMGRGGATAEDWTALVTEAAALAADGSIEVVGIWSHLACADEPGSRATADQVEVFTAALAVAERAGLRPQVRHLAASSGTLLAPQTHFDLVRPGISIYGLTPAPLVASSAELGLRPAMRLEAGVIHVKDVPAGTPVSYGHTYTTPDAGRLAIVPLGYGDGILRHASNVGPVLIGGHRSTVAGRVCMDQFTVDLGPAGVDVEAGSTAVLFGDGRDGEPTAQDWADVTGTISYEIVTRLSSRVPRTHLFPTEPR